jgi:phage gp29-like protein
VPRGASPTEINTFFENLKALDRKTKAIVCKRSLDGSGFDFEYVDAGNGEIDSFERSIEMAHKAKAILVLGQSLTTDVADSGSRALGQVHNQIRYQLIRADAEGFVTAVREQIIKPWARYNFGRAEVAPWPRYDHKPPADRKVEADTHTAAAAAVVALSGVLEGTGKELDRVAYLERLDIPLRDVKPAAPAPVVAPAPAAPAPKPPAPVLPN